MVNYNETLSNVFSALSDPTRRAILTRLADGEFTVSELAEPFMFTPSEQQRMSLPAVSKHLRILESAGLIHRRKEGRTHYISLVAAPMQTASDWLQNYQVFWDTSFDALAKLVERDEDFDSA